MTNILEHSYDAERDRPSMLRFVGELPLYPLVIAQHWTLVRNFFRREFHGRFRGSVLGAFWVLVHPLFLFLTYYLVFGIMFNMRGEPGWHPMRYPLYMFVGVVAWSAFVETTIGSTTIVVDNGNLIKKVSFPSHLLPVHLVSVNMLVFVVGVLAYLLVAITTGFDQPGPGWAMLSLPLVMLVQALFTIGLSLLLAAGYVFLRDLRHIYPILAQFWFFTTPVSWHEAMFPKGSSIHSVMPLLRLNPMYSILQAHRVALGMLPGGIPEVLRQSMHALGPAAGIFALGYLYFRSVHHRFADEV